MSKLNGSKHELVVQEMPTNPRFIDRTGVRYGRLTVDGYVGERGKKHIWSCVCNCGERVEVTGNNLVTGHTTSCGCAHSKDPLARFTMHGKRSSPVYNVWANIKQRCYNPCHPDYKTYGARGIRLSEEFHSFAAFYEFITTVLGPKPDPTWTLDRIDLHGGYERGNLQWLDLTGQARKKTNSWTANFLGVQTPVIELCEIFGLPRHTVYARVRVLGWTLADALATPVGKKRPPSTTPLGQAAPLPIP